MSLIESCKHIPERDVSHLVACVYLLPFVVFNPGQIMREIQTKGIGSVQMRYEAAQRIILRDLVPKVK